VRAEALLGLPPELVYGVAFVFGALWGSFLNVCIVRLPRARSVVFGGSRCVGCDAPIRAYDNIPIVSYLVLRGRCRACGARISPRYPIVELLMAMLTLAIVHRFGISISALAYFLLAMGLVVLTFVDLEYFIIPDEVSYSLAVLGLGLAFVPGATVPPLDAAIGALVGAGALLLLGLVFRLVRRVQGIGFGDIKLLVGLGAFLGYRQLPFLFVLAALQGLLAAGVVFTARRGRPLEPAPLPEEEETRDEARVADDGPPPGRLALPFGPFLALASLEIVFFGPALWDLSRRVWSP
jgi:leader peptidase (prepilin peptidase)/N-methyltransferase